jgi:AcrR family transcriptional regulator
MKQGAKGPLDGRTDHQRESHTLWFNPLLAEGPPPPLTRERVVAEALTVIAQEGVGALTMRTLAARLGVVPGALYRRVRNKEQLQDLVLDGVLAEVNCNLNPSLAWSEQLTLLAHRRPTGRRSTRNRPQPPGPPDHVKTRKWRRTDDHQAGNPMSIGVRCGSCDRELLLVQLASPAKASAACSAASPSRPPTRPWSPRSASLCR